LAGKSIPRSIARGMESNAEEQGCLYKRNSKETKVVHCWIRR
jgi:hypothetical protein